jgi:hypothetical protein
LAIGGDYSVPVMVNGYSCHNCTEVSEAQKHIDPAHPKAGPYGIDAKNDPTVNQASTTAQTPNQTPAVQFGGVLAGSTATSGSAANQPFWATSAPGGQIDLSA